MAKKSVEKAIKEAHDTADKAIDEAQKELRETRQEVFAWLKTQHTFTRAELIIIGIGAAMTIATLLLL